MDEGKKKLYTSIDEDRLVTKSFEIVGRIQKQDFDFKSQYGLLKIKFADLKKVSVMRGGEAETIKKAIQITAQDNQYRYKSAGIRVNPGDKIKIVATGVINITSYGYSCGPEGNSSNMGIINGQYPSGMLVARVGSSGSVVKVGANKTFTANMDISVTSNQEYRFVVTNSENGFTIKLRNETVGAIELEHSFELKDGKFTRVF